jgi:hypothetical protein
MIAIMHPPQKKPSSIKISLSSSKFSSWLMKVEIEDLSPTKQSKRTTLG